MNDQVFIFNSDTFQTIIEEALFMFDQIPPKELERQVFSGVGVYGLYYVGTGPLYEQLGIRNAENCLFPIYIGKAVPQGWRQSKTVLSDPTKGNELAKRLNEHMRSIDSVSNLFVAEFKIKAMCFDRKVVDMISSVESRLISKLKPLWNTTIDGFGNHDPGKGRYQQAKSDWDVLHPGRSWAAKCEGIPNNKAEILEQVKQVLD